MRMKFCPKCGEGDNYGTLWMLYCSHCDTDLEEEE